MTFTTQSTESSPEVSAILSIMHHEKDLSFLCFVGNVK